MYCKNCGAEITFSANVCPQCGLTLKNEYKNQFDFLHADMPKGDVYIRKHDNFGFDKAAMGAGVRRIRRRRIAMLLVALIIITAVIVSAVIIISGEITPEDMAVVYVKDGVLTARLKDELSIADVVTKQARLSADGKYLFYLTDGGKLYCRDIKKEKSKIADNSEGLLLSENAADFELFDKHSVIYLDKTENDALRIFNGKKITEVDDSAKSFEITDGNRVLYLKSSGKETYALWECALKKPGNKSQLAEDVSRYEHFLGGIICFKESGNGTYILRMLSSEGEEKIADNVSESVILEGSLYFWKVRRENLSFSDLIDDDLRQSDAALTEPDITDFKYEYEGSGGRIFTGYDYDAYTEKMTEYEDKITRDEIRKDGMENTVGYAVYDLYRYDENGVSEVQMDCFGYPDFYNDAAVLTVYEFNKVIKTEFSKLFDDGYRKWTEIIANIDLTVPEKAVLTQAQAVTVLENVDSENIIAVLNGYIFTLDRTRTLAKHGITGKGKTEIAKNVSRVEISDTGKLLYYASGSLHISDGEEGILVGNSVSDAWFESDEVLLFFSDVNAGAGTLNMYTDGECVELDENVLLDSVDYRSKDYVYYLKADTSGSGALYRYKNGKNKLLEENISEILLCLSKEK